MSEEKALQEMGRTMAALVALANVALSEKGYTFPFVLVLVSSDHAVFAMEFANRDEPPVTLCDSSGDRGLDYPLNFFLTCRGKTPITAVLNAEDASPTWIN
jgi:hypothetical protein